MGYIIQAKELIERLYDQGSTNNEELQSLLIYLKEVSNSNPESLRNEFLEIFPELAVSENVLSSTNIMLMMLLVHFAMQYRPTTSSRAYIESRQQEEEFLTQLRGAEMILRNYFQTKISS